MTQRIGFYQVSVDRVEKDGSLTVLEIGFAAFPTRWNMAAFLREKMRERGFPDRRFGDAGISTKWTLIQRYGSSCVHFSVDHEGMIIHFSGLTEEEYWRENG